VELEIHPADPITFSLEALHEVASNEAACAAD
jgi:hypothetical protein